MLTAFVRSTLAVAIGYAVSAALFWALVNVPESNVFMLGLSAALVASIVVGIGLTTGTAAALSQGESIGAAARRGLAALPSFVAGLAVCAALWWLSGVVDRRWNAAAGEIDAWFLRYAGFTRTALLHQGVAWATWLVRWVLGLSIVVGLVSVAAVGERGSRGAGVRLAARLVPLAALLVAVLIVSGGLWRVAAWRPAGLPATWIEPAFALTKLGVLYVAAAATSAGVLGVYGRSARA